MTERIKVLSMIDIIFYVFATFAVFSGVMVVASSNPVRGALFLILTFFSMAGIWLLLQAEFLALVLVLVYVGAVMTLFLFVVMMLRVNVVSLREGFVRYFPFAILLVLLMIGLSVFVIDKNLHLAIPALKPADYSNLANLGEVLYTDYVYPFEIAALMLLTAIVAAISLTHRPPKHRKSQNPSQQVLVKRCDRVRLIKLSSQGEIDQ